MTKKRSSEILADVLGKFYPRLFVTCFSETVENTSLAQMDGRPCSTDLEFVDEYGGLLLPSFPNVVTALSIQ